MSTEPPVVHGRSLIEDMDGAEPGDARAVAELAGIVVTPAPYAVVTAPCARVDVAGGNLDDVIEVGDCGWHVPVDRGPVAYLSVTVIPPALDRTRAQETRKRTSGGKLYDARWFLGNIHLRITIRAAGVDNKFTELEASATAAREERQRTGHEQEKSTRSTHEGSDWYYLMQLVEHRAGPVDKSQKITVVIREGVRSIDGRPMEPGTHVFFPTTKPGRLCGTAFLEVSF